ncbi:ULK kinase [Toxoplasma gondii p89]|uniref:ULK kinase n=1 Tax=Toxoplasma gondii p89 TaxID=943119 RepID=A0A086K355_TOXGO|nr:ULK kinase [Toxoplasma gondii p89]
MGNQQAGCSGVRGRGWDMERRGLRGFDGKYRPLRVLGSGQFSTVYECVRVEDPSERYAMKVMSCWTWDSRTLRRIEEEISIMQELGQSHSCLVRLVDSYKERICLSQTSRSRGEPNSFPFDNLPTSSMPRATGVPVSDTQPPLPSSGPSTTVIEQSFQSTDDSRMRCIWRIALVLDFCGGGDLADYLNRHGALDENQARSIIFKICHGLAFLHERGIIHRDIKPENILIAKDDGNTLDIKISDFGLAKKMSGRFHRSLSLCGSDFYLPPEMLQQRPYDTQADMWSVGVLGFAVLFGCSAFCSMELTTLYQQIIERRLSIHPSSPKSTVSAGAWKFLLDLLQVQPYKRLNAHRALKHRWLRGSLSAEELCGLPALSVDGLPNSSLPHGGNKESIDVDKAVPIRDNAPQQMQPTTLDVKVTVPSKLQSMSLDSTYECHSINKSMLTTSIRSPGPSSLRCTDQDPMMPRHTYGFPGSSKEPLVDLGFPFACTAEAKRLPVLRC